MSMTQEEIEALMNETSFDTDDSSQTPSNEENIDDILAGIDGVIDDGSSSDNQTKTTEETTENIDDILAGIDGIEDSSSNSSNETIQNEEQPKTNESIEEKIDEGIYPLPASSEHQVVNQLSQVAEDSEEKASQIFDVLSFILDENEVIQTNNTKISDFVNNQLNLLEKLNLKFPNIELFSQNINLANEAKEAINTISNTVDNENAKVFEAMELMQYHDINRQKIERVMSVIKKLAEYLNGLFSDDSNKPEVQIAKHISGDSKDTVTEDDLESLISEFNH